MDKSDLEQAIQAVKAGEHALARSLLSQIVKDQPDNLAAWLWLSSVLEGKDAKRQCLENVLALDPQNAAAQRGLSKLAEAKVAPPKQQVFRRKYEPISTAAAVLYPESQVLEWEDEPLLERQPEAAVEYQVQSTYHDVWSQDLDICAFCAQPVAWEDQRCSQCRRSLTEKRFRYSRPSADLYVLFVLLMGSSVVFAMQLLYDLVGQASSLVMIAHGLIPLALFVLSLAVYARQPWGYWAALAILPLALASALFSEVDSDAVARYIPASPISPGLTVIAEALIGMVVAFIQPLQVLAAALSLAYAVFRCGSDFIRVKVRHLAEVEPGLRAASDYYAAGQRYAQKGMWASAILHWQRAAANEPNRAYYQRVLGDAFARLGFFRRSLDLYQSAHRLTNDPKIRQSLERRITELGVLAKNEKAAGS